MVVRLDGALTVFAVPAERAERRELGGEEKAECTMDLM